ncbi:MAG: 50S ribosomal protein L33 [Thermodesulfovibrio sp.]|nr:50S ribosomal protein L33 [Thermodesulfovibrio sp.]
MRDIILLQCTECKSKNYSTTKNKKNTPDKLQLKKYCKHCKRHTLHKETKA